MAIFKRSLLSCAFSIAVFVIATSAQNLCRSGVQSDKLICLVPQVYGPNGLVLEGSAGDFNNSFLTSNLRPLNSAIARQSILLPLASPSSGLAFKWDPITKAFVQSANSFGPILGERAETIGRHRVLLAVSYQYVRFNTIDGLSLDNLPQVFTQPDFTLTTGEKCSLGVNDVRECGFIRDVVTTSNSVDLKVHYYSSTITYGLFDKMDLSVVIPVENVRMGITSNATIVNNSNTTIHSFAIQNGCGRTTPTFEPCINQSFSRFGTASGIGDITLRWKWAAWKAEKAGLALGVDVRLPTGDAQNFLGSGAAGVKPFVAWSYLSRFSPHISVGYEANGSSVLAGDITVGSKDRLPSQLTYSGGADVWVTKRVTLAFDIVGQQVFQASRSSLADIAEPQACLDTSGNCDPSKGFAKANMDKDLKQSTGSFSITNASIGIRMRPFSNLLITGNVLAKINEGGLRPNWVPLISASYVF